MAETRKIIRIEDSDLNNLANRQIGVESGNDADLGFPMYGGKDGSGNLYKFLCKDENARVEALTINDLAVPAAAGIPKYNAAGLIQTQADIGLLYDVDITSVQNGEVLKYNSTSGKWENDSAASGALTYKGTWNATTNTPVLGDSGAGGIQGDYYIVSTAGNTSIDGESSWAVGDWITHNGTTWDKIDNTDLVTSVNGATGAIVVTLDGCYDADSGERTITVDDGDVSFDLSGAYSVAVDLSGASGTADGFQVTNGTDSVNMLYAATNQIAFTAVVEDMGFSVADALSLSADTIEASSTNDMTLESTAGNIDIDAFAFVQIDAGNGVEITSAGDNLVLTGDGTNEIDIDNTGSTVDIDCSTLDIDTSTSIVLNTDTFTVDCANTSYISCNDFDFTIETITSGNLILSAAGNIDIDGIDLDADFTGKIELLSVGNADIGTTDISNDLTFYARDESIPLNESGEESLDGSFSAISIIGALNELSSTNSDNLDDAYNNFGTNEARVIVDSAQSQNPKNVTWEMHGQNSFVVDIANGSGNGTASSFIVQNGTDNFKLHWVGSNAVNLEAALGLGDIDFSDTLDIDSVGAMGLRATGASVDLTLGGRGATITLNESGDTTLSGFTATSIIGALNELAGGSTPVTHNNLTGLQGGTTDEYYHLTNTQHTDLTDTGDSALHYHSTDRARANHTGTQTKSTISDFAHASTHASGAGDEIDGDTLDIDWNPSNYTPATTPSQVTSVDELTAHMYGIDQVLGTATSHIAATAAHGATGAVVGTTNTQTLLNKTLTSPEINTQITLNQTTANYTLSWSNPGAARAISIPDPGGADTFVFASMTQTLAGKTLTTPTIADFTNATHDHSNAANGGTIAHSDITGLGADDHHNRQHALDSTSDHSALSDNTNFDATTGQHGFLPKLGGGTTNFLRADGTWAAPASTGEANTASNQGSGTSIFYQKSGVDLQFNAIKSENDRLGVALDAGTHDVELTINEGNIVHQNLSGAGTNTHAQIDTHIASTANPHSVDKTDVGLANVTNNAQVKKIGSSTDNAVMRWDGTSGDTPQDSGVTISDTNDMDMGGGAISSVGNVDGRDVSADGSKLDGIESGADQTDATNVDAAGAVMESDYDAQTILRATTDNTPTTLTVSEQTVVGRLTGGNITDISLGIADNNIVQIDHASVADNDYAKFTANGLEGRSYAEVLSDIGALPRDVEINAQTGTTYSLVAGDAGKLVTLNNASAITLTVPSGLGSGFTCTILQIGAGQVTVSESSTTVNNRNSHTKLAGQYAAATLTAYATNTFLLQGDTAS